MERAFSQTSYSPTQVDFLELHATGTAGESASGELINFACLKSSFQAGDPTEANWVGSTFGGREQELLLGSVKGNIG
jgi:acyl transferase domain-containing protein